MAVYIQTCIYLHLYIQNDHLHTKCPLTESKFTERHVDFLHVSLSLQHIFYTWIRVGDPHSLNWEQEDTGIFPLYETLS